MTDYDFLIKEKNENTDFDGKKTIYKQDTFFDLLKDVMAIANADIENDRHIVTGISLQRDEERLIGIDKGEFQDPSTYQEFVHQNIEPTIDLRCFLREYEGKNFGIFEISNCNNPPYMMKKAYQRKSGVNISEKKNDILQRGEAWIRKNTDQDRMIRNDFERIYDKKHKKHGFRGELKLYFSHTKSEILQLSTFDEMLLPSKRDFELVTKIIDDKRRDIENQPNLAFNLLKIFRSYFLRIFVPQEGIYLLSTVEKLEEIQNEMKEFFSFDDYNELFSLHASRINVYIENLGDEYLEDASIKFVIHQIEGIALYDHEPRYLEPNKKRILPNPFNYYMKHLSDYPNTVYHYNKIEIPLHIGEIEHHIPKKIFPNPLRIALNKSMAGKTIEITCIIYGKNLREPLCKKLKIQGLSY